jgi:uncharacterized protein YkwD
MHTTTRALLTLLAVTVIYTLSAPTHAADLSATNTVYLPLVACANCTGSRQVVTPTPVTPTPVTPTPAPGADAAEVIRLVNIERVKVGCPEVVAEPQLIAATQAWAEYMQANSYYHHATASWYAPYGYPGGTLENIGGNGTPALTVEAWMASTPHRRNLLDCYPIDDPSYDPRRIYVAGVGHAGPYWVWGLVDKLP